MCSDVQNGRRLRSSSKAAPSLSRAARHRHCHCRHRASWLSRRRLASAHVAMPQGRHAHPGRHGGKAVCAQRKGGGGRRGRVGALRSDGDGRVWAQRGRPGKGRARRPARSERPARGKRVRAEASRCGKRCEVRPTVGDGTVPCQASPRARGRYCLLFQWMQAPLTTLSLAGRRLRRAVGRVSMARACMLLCRPDAKWVGSLLRSATYRACMQHGLVRGANGQAAANTSSCFDVTHALSREFVTKHGSKTCCCCSSTTTSVQSLWV